MRLKFDLHVHTNHSPDSTISPKDLIQKSKKFGIAPAITDHNSISAHKEFENQSFIPGEEILTFERYDLIGLYLTELIPVKTPFLEALDLIKSQGAISYLPHMFDTTRKGCADEKLAKKVDAIEIFNGRAFGGCNKKAEQFAEKNKKLKGVGSDTHFLFEFGKTYLELPGDFSDYFDNPKKFLKDLPKANYATKNSPIYVRGTTKLFSILRKFKR